MIAGDGEDGVGGAGGGSAGGDGEGVEGVGVGGCSVYVSRQGSNWGEGRGEPTAVECSE